MITLLILIVLLLVFYKEIINSLIDLTSATTFTASYIFRYCKSHKKTAIGIGIALWAILMLYLLLNG